MAAETLIEPLMWLETSEMVYYNIEKFGEKGKAGKR
jgi:hypothetical protein